MNRRTLLLILIVALAFGLRITGINFESYHPDERSVFRMARTMIDQKTLEPTRFAYGSLTAYFQAALLFPLEAVHNLVRGTDGPLPSGLALTVVRFVSVLSSCMTVFLTAVITRRCFESPISHVGKVSLIELLPPLFTAVSFVSVQCAHYSTVDSLMTMFGTLATLKAFDAHRSHRTADYVFSAIFVGLAMATKYTGVLSGLPLLAACLLPGRSFDAIKKSLLSGICILLGFMIGMPYAFISFDKFLKAVTYESRHYREGIDTIFAVGQDTWKWNLEFLYYSGVGPAILVMAVIGFFLLLIMRRSTPWLPTISRRIILIAWPLSVYLFTSMYTTRFDRNLLPLIPFLSIWAALFIGLCDRILVQRRWISPLLFSIVLFATLYPISRCIVFDWQLTFPHTKRQLASYLRSLPKDEKVTRHGRALTQSLRYYQSTGSRYLIMSSHSYEPVAAFPDRYPDLARHYPEIFQRCEATEIFSNPWFASDFFAPHHLLNSATVNVYHGPTLIVFKVPDTDSALNPSSLQTRPDLTPIEDIDDEEL